MNCGDIYCVTSPSGKQYVGQCVQFLSNGKRWGYECRWKQHVRDAYNGKDYCRLLNASIRKYGPDKFSIELLKTCDILELDRYENIYIESLDTMTPRGYNLVSGKSMSRQSEETKEKRRQSMLGVNVGRVYEKRPRKRPEDNNLPKYVRYYYDKTGKEGYRISNHPKLLDKSFVGKYISLETKLDRALAYLTLGNTR